RRPTQPGLYHLDRLRLRAQVDRRPGEADPPRRLRLPPGARWGEPVGMVKVVTGALVQHTNPPEVSAPALGPTGPSSGARPEGGQNITKMISTITVSDDAVISAPSGSPPASRCS